MIDQPPDEFWVMPEMQMIDALVHMPEAEMAGGEIGPFGAIAIGPAHIPGEGSAMCIAIIGRDGQAHVATLGNAQWAAFGEMANVAAERLEAGEFSQPRVPN